MCKYEKDRPVFYKIQHSISSQNNTNESYLQSISNVDDKTVNSDDEAVTKIKNLLVIKCKTCKQVFKTKKELMFHFKQHSSLLCITCLENNHQFWYEYTSYTPETLSLHRKGLLKEPGFEGHLFCPFCSVWLYNKETARKHCNQEHQICTVCDSMGIKFQFYRNFKELEDHYRSKHYCCDNTGCIQSYCYVYAYKSELCAHMLAQHGIERQLGDVHMKNEKNPTVFSLHEAGMEESSLGIGFVSPLVNGPYYSTPSFPSFSNNNTVPGFLDRSIIHQTNTLTSQRIDLLKGMTSFYNEISIIVGKYIDSLKTLSEMVSEIEECVGKDLCYKILLKVSFLQKQKEIEQFLKEYKKELKFPTFKKEQKKIEEPKKSSVGFKIIDFTKKK